MKSNATVEVFTYLGREEWMQPRHQGACLPSEDYKSVIVEGAVEHELPAEYIERLRLIQDNGYASEVDLSISA